MIGAQAMAFDICDAAEVASAACGIAPYYICSEEYATRKYSFDAPTYIVPRIRNLN
jgi:hypothetical protein